MNMENVMFDSGALYEEIVSRGQEEGITTQGAYNDFVDFVVNEKLQVGEMDKNDDMNDIIEDLKARWPEYQEILGS